MLNLTNRSDETLEPVKPEFVKSLVWVWVAGYGTAALVLAGIFGLGRVLELGGL